ncbi:MAG: carboxypeptidase regulatory-like domain-containing protein [Gemmatimonadetes bacterium]|nr:carboxypeptidase regulatory-like domain-containing protein [Gemmatimonadota bacterium]
MRNSALVLAALALASAGVAPCLHAQTLQGQVVDTVTGTPVGTGFVVLLGADDTEFYRTLTTRDGHFTFRLSPYHRGPFRLRSERIGYRVSVTDWFHVSSEDTRNLIIRVSALPVPLSSIEVRESTECKVRPTEDEQTAVVWEEARKALAAASWTALQQLYHVVSNLYDRDMDGRRRRVRQEHHRPSIGLSSMPFVARAPIELLQNGYVSDEDGVVVYYAPDAEVLQDDGFLGTHCFRLRRGDDEEAALIGLGFEPVPSRKLPDVEGVLWLDRQSSELRSLEFRYVNLPRHLRADGPSGGTVEFMPLPSGAWIVHRWRIGIPTAFREERVNPLARELRRRADAFRYTGGEVLTITDGAGNRVYQAVLAQLTGVVVDSTRGEPQPLAGAIVRIAGSWFADTTDAEGRFNLGAPLNGEYDVGFTHPRAVLLAYVPPLARVTLARGRTDTLRLALPSVEAIVRGLCPDQSGAYARVLVGTVRDSVTGRPVQGVQVAASWQLINSDLSYRNRQAVAATDASGHYVLCGLEHGRPAVVYALGEHARSAPVRVSFEGTGVEVGEEYHQTAETAAGLWHWDLTLHPRLKSSALVVGLVTDVSTGNSIPDAVVTIGDPALTTKTDSTGMFQLEGPSAGTHRLTLRRPGYQTRWGEVEVHRDQPTIIGASSLTLTPVAHVAGTVAELETGDPVADVWLTLISAQGESVAMSRSDDSGKFILTAPAPGPYYVAARRIGYTPDITGPFQLRTGHAVDIEFPIAPSAFGLEPITVTGKPAVPFLSTVGFYDRQRAGFGVFLDREAIEKRAGASELGHLLQAIPGVRVDANGLIRLRGIGAGPDGTPCHLSPPLVFVDGFRIEPVEMGQGSGLITPNSWTRAIHPIHIEAIEVYRTPAEIPAQYNTGGEAACGVILIWTRRGGY